MSIPEPNRVNRFSGTPAKPWLGLSVEEAIDGHGDKSLHVVSIAKGGPADVAGLALGDIPVSFGGLATPSIEAFGKAFAAHGIIGRSVDIVYFRPSKDTAPGAEAYDNFKTTLRVAPRPEEQVAPSTPATPNQPAEAAPPQTPVAAPAPPSTESQPTTAAPQDSPPVVEPSPIVSAPALGSASMEVLPVQAPPAAPAPTPVLAVAPNRDSAPATAGPVFEVPPALPAPAAASTPSPPPRPTSAPIAAPVQPGALALVPVPVPSAAPVPAPAPSSALGPTTAEMENSSSTEPKEVIALRCEGLLLEPALNLKHTHLFVRVSLRGGPSVSTCRVPISSNPIFPDSPVVLMQLREEVTIEVLTERTGPVTGPEPQSRLRRLFACLACRPMGDMESTCLAHRTLDLTLLAQEGEEFQIPLKPDGAITFVRRPSRPPPQPAEAPAAEEKNLCENAAEPSESAGPIVACSPDQLPRWTNGLCTWSDIHQNRLSASGSHLKRSCSPSALPSPLTAYNHSRSSSGGRRRPRSEVSPSPKPEGMETPDIAPPLWMSGLSRIPRSGTLPPFGSPDHSYSRGRISLSPGGVRVRNDKLEPEVVATEVRVPFPQWKPPLGQWSTWSDVRQDGMPTQLSALPDPILWPPGMALVRAGS
eukprot:RCo008519